MTGDQIALWGLMAAVAAIVFSLIIGWALYAVTHANSRETLARWLESGAWRDRYHASLAKALTWLDATIGPAPLTRSANAGSRTLGLQSLWVCIALSMAYSLLASLIGWTAGAPGSLGGIKLFEVPTWLPANLPAWLQRSLSVVIAVGGAALVFLSLRTYDIWLSRRADARSRRGRQRLGSAAFAIFL